MTLRVLHVLDHSIPIQTGYTYRTLAILREQRKLGWETFHVTGPKQGDSGALEEIVDGWHFFRTPGTRSSRSVSGFTDVVLVLARIAWRLATIAAETRPHVIHVHSPVLNALPAIRVGRRLGIPVVYEIRAFWEDAAVDHGTATKGGVRYKLSRYLETVAVRRADHVTTICEGLRTDLLSRGISSDKITVIPNAVDTDQFTPGCKPDAQLTRALGLEGSTVLGFIGSFYAYEGLDLLIEALPAIIQRQGNVKLLLVGGGPHEMFLRKLAVDQAVSDRVVFAGRVPNSQVCKYYDLIDLLIYARRSMRLTELVTPLKPLEAMAQGRVFLASDVGGHRELVAHGKTGFLFRSGDAAALIDAVSSVLTNDEQRQEVCRAARRFVEQERTWGKSVARYQEVYAAITRLRGE